MRRRSAVVVSSDDDDADYSIRANCNPSSPNSERYFGQAKHKVQKKPFTSNSHLRKRQRADDPTCDALFEDFYRDFVGRKIAPGEDRGQKVASTFVDSKELWIDKYKPCSVADLAVHKKKIEEVDMWLEERFRNPMEHFHGYSLVITGQAGVGKSATINVIASKLGAEVCEWKTPTPTLWPEYIHNANSGINYVSKLDEFELFVEKARKYSLLTSTSKDGSKRPVILLIDDLPVTNGRVAYGRLNRCLHFLVQSTHIPTIILVTEYGRADSVDNRNYREELVSSLERSGASKVTFNPITVNSIKRVLSRICREEKCSVSSEWIEHIARVSGGDIRHAITSFQYLCFTPDPLTSSAISVTHTKGKLEDLYEMSTLRVNGHGNSNYEVLSSFGRDETLTLFHALGKFLHNKRDTMDIEVFEKDALILKDKYKRFPLKMGSPESVIDQAHGQARPIAEFLHENALDFISEDAVDDAWVVSSYLSDVDCLLAINPHRFSVSPIITGKHGLENVLQEVSASVAVRGVLFGNEHPSPSRWHAIRRPKLWQVEQAWKHNKKQMLLEKCEAYDMFSSYDLSSMATEFRPFFKWLGFESVKELQICTKMTQQSKLEVRDLHSMDQGQLETDATVESEEDEIEDW